MNLLLPVQVHGFHSSLHEMLYYTRNALLHQPEKQIDRD